jgi:hypothetical protein
MANFEGPKTVVESITLNLENNQKYRNNESPKLPFGKAIGLDSYTGDNLAEILKEQDTKIVDTDYTVEDKLNHRHNFACLRDYKYMNQSRRAIYVHGYRSKLIKENMNKASKLRAKGAKLS